MLILKDGQFEVVVENDPTYTSKSVDNQCSYDQTYPLGSDPFVSSCHAIKVSNSTGHVSSCILTAGGGATGIHENSALILGSSCLLAIGPFIASINLPMLEMNWAQEVDQATCFGVYNSTKYNCLISHGELEIVRLSPGGEIIWRAGGADIFTNGFTMHENTIEVNDFNDKRYIIEISTGREVAA